MSTNVDWNKVLGALGEALGEGVKGFSRGGAHSLYHTLAQQEGGSSDFIQKIRNYPYGEEWVNAYLKNLPIDQRQGYRSEIEDLAQRINYFSSLGTPEGKATADSLQQHLKRLQEEEKSYKDSIAGYTKDTFIPYKERGKNAHKLLELYDLLKENNKERKEQKLNNWISDIWRRAHLFKGELLAMNDLERIIGAKAFAALNFKEKAGTNVSQREFETIMRKFVSPNNTYRYNIGVLHEPLLTSLVHAAFSRAYDTVDPRYFKDLYDYQRAIGKKGFELLKQDRRFLEIAQEAQRLGSDVVNLISHEMLIPLENIENVEKEESYSDKPPTSGTLGEIEHLIKELPPAEREILSQSENNPTLLQKLTSDTGKILKGFLFSTPLGLWDGLMRGIILPLSKATAQGIALENRELLDLPLDEALQRIQSPEFKEGSNKVSSALTRYTTPSGLIDEGVKALGSDGSYGTKAGDVLGNVALFGGLNKNMLSSGEKFLDSVSKWAGKSAGQGLVTQGLQDLGVNPLVADMAALGAPSVNKFLPDKKPVPSLRERSYEDVGKRWYRGAAREKRALRQDMIREAEKSLEPFIKQLKTDPNLLENPIRLEAERNRLYNEAHEMVPKKVNPEIIKDVLEKRISEIERKTPSSLRTADDNKILEELKQIRRSLENDITGEQLEAFRQEAKLSKEYDPLLPRHEQTFKTRRGKILEEIGDEILSKESPEYGSRQAKANEFYRQSQGEREVKKILEKITDTFSSQQTKNRLEKLDLRENFRIIKDVLPEKLAANLWDVAQDLEELMKKVQLVEQRTYGHPRYIGGTVTPPISGIWWLKKWFNATSYKSLLSGRYKREWKAFLEAIKKGSVSKTEKALTQLKALESHMREEDRIARSLAKIFNKYMTKGATAQEWKTFSNTAGKELRRLEKKENTPTDSKQAIREMLKESQEKGKIKPPTKRRS